MTISRYHSDGSRRSATERKLLNEAARKRSDANRQARGAYCRWCQATESANVSVEVAKSRRDSFGFIAHGKGNSSKRRSARS